MSVFDHALATMARQCCRFATHFRTQYKPHPAPAFFYLFACRRDCRLKWPLLINFNEKKIFLAVYGLSSCSVDDLLSLSLFGVVNQPFPWVHMTQEHAPAAVPEYF